MSEDQSIVRVARSSAIPHGAQEAPRAFVASGVLEAQGEAEKMHAGFVRLKS